MNLHIHVRESDGEIFGFENTDEPQEQPGCIIATIEVPDGRHCVPNPRLHKFDLTAWELVDKTPDERALGDMPTVEQVRNKIARELQVTDAFVVPDRPMAGATRAAWVTYRQALRDLSKLASPSEMLAAWPSRPV